MDEVEGVMDIVVLVLPKDWGPQGLENIKYVSFSQYCQPLPGSQPSSEAILYTLSVYE
jgi:hypothetical protein